MRLVTPFVYRKYLDYDAYERLARRASPDPRAGQAPRLRDQHQARARAAFAKSSSSCRRCSWCAADASRRCATAARCRRWRRWRARGVLPAAAVSELRDAYVFLRNLEHRLQYRDDAQTQDLPARRRRAACAGERLRLRRCRSVRGGARFASRCRRRAISTCSSARRPPTTPIRWLRCGCIARGDPERATARSPTPATTIRRRDRRAGAGARQRALSAAARRVAPALRRAGAAAAARRRGRPRTAVAVFLRLLVAAGDDQRPQRVSRAAGRASADPAAASRSWSAPARGPPTTWRATRSCSTSCSTTTCSSPSPTGTPGDASSPRTLAAAPGGRRAADRRPAPFPARADVSPAGAGPERDAVDRAPRRPPVGARRRRARGDAGMLLGAGARRRSARARSTALRDRRLRQARRQGARLRVRSGHRLPVRRSARRRGRALRAPGAADQRVAHQRDRRRTPVRDRPAPSSRRRERPAGIEPRRVSPATSADRRGRGSIRR